MHLIACLSHAIFPSPRRRRSPSRRPRRRRSWPRWSGSVKLLRHRIPGEEIDFSALPLLKALHHYGPLRVSALAERARPRRLDGQPARQGPRGPRPARAHRRPGRRRAPAGSAVSEHGTACLEKGAAVRACPDRRGMADGPTTTARPSAPCCTGCPPTSWTSRPRPTSTHPSRPPPWSTRDPRLPGLPVPQADPCGDGRPHGGHVPRRRSTRASSAPPSPASPPSSAASTSCPGSSPPTCCAATASTPLWGKISDLYGRRLLFQIAIVTFLVGSLLAGFSARTSSS